MRENGRMDYSMAKENTKEKIRSGNKDNGKMVKGLNEMLNFEMLIFYKIWLFYH